MGKGIGQVTLIIALCIASLFVADANQYKVGGLDAWAVPVPGRSNQYKLWSSHLNFTVGDSLLFLYPPSQDSVVQLAGPAYQRCDISKPILKMEDGNSLFNITKPGAFYFASGKPGHCEKEQKFAILVAGADGVLPSDPYATPAPYSSSSSSSVVADGPSNAFAGPASGPSQAMPINGAITFTPAMPWYLALFFASLFL